jgi:hypothetical protein
MSDAAKGFIIGMAVSSAIDGHWQAAFWQLAWFVIFSAWVALDKGESDE